MFLPTAWNFNYVFIDPQGVDTVNLDGVAEGAGSTGLLFTSGETFKAVLKGTTWYITRHGGARYFISASVGGTIDQAYFRSGGRLAIFNLSANATIDFDTVTDYPQGYKVSVSHQANASGYYMQLDPFGSEQLVLAAGSTQWFITSRVLGKNAVLVSLQANQACTTGAWTTLSFGTGSEVYKDVGNMHSTTVNPTRLTVPEGASRVKLHGQVTIEGNVATDIGIRITKGGAWLIDGWPSQSIGPTGNPQQINVSSPALEVTAGDYFELELWHDHGSNRNAFGSSSGQYTWFNMEVVG